MKTIVEVSNLFKTYEDFKLNNISFTIPEGTITGLIGENGAGKSTIIKALLNLVHPDKGEIKFWGEDIDENNSNLKENIGVVFDELKFPEDLTPKEIGNIFSNLYKNWDTKIYLENLDKFNLPLDSRIKTFSKGMKMKLQIATALSHNCKLLILDEVTNGLDPVVRDDLLEILLDFIQNEECSVLISSHNLMDIEKIADYVLFIHDGNFIFNVLKDDLRDKMGIVRCSKEEFNYLDQENILAFQELDYQYNVIVWDKFEIIQHHPELCIDSASIDEILLIYLKGERI